MRLPVFVLMRGLGRELGHWDRFPEILKESLPHSQIVLLDMPGVGDHREETSPLQVHTYVTLMREKLIKVLGGEEVYSELVQDKAVHLVGVSLGAMIAIQWSVQFAKEVTSVVLINTSLGRFSMPWKRLTPKASSLLLLEWPKLKDAHQREKRLAHFLTHAEDRHQVLSENWAQIALERPVDYINLSRQLLSAASYLGPAQLLCPGLVLVSAKDQMVHPDCSRVLRKKWGVCLYEHSWAGHDMICDDPHWVSQKIKIFFGELSADQGAN